MERRCGYLLKPYIELGKVIFYGIYSVYEIEEDKIPQLPTTNVSGCDKTSRRFLLIAFILANLQIQEAVVKCTHCIKPQTDLNTILMIHQTTTQKSNQSRFKRMPHLAVCVHTLNFTASTNC